MMVQKIRNSQELHRINAIIMARYFINSDDKISTYI